MNKIITEHYPAERLPVDLRRGLPAGSRVTVVVTEEPGEPTPLTSKEAVALIQRLRMEAGGKGLSPEEAAADVRLLRDEWN